MNVDKVICIDFMIKKWSLLFMYLVYSYYSVAQEKTVPLSEHTYKGIFLTLTALPNEQEESLLMRAFEDANLVVDIKLKTTDSKYRIWLLKSISEQKVSSEKSALSVCNSFPQIDIVQHCSLNTLSLQVDESSTSFGIREPRSAGITLTFSIWPTQEKEFEILQMTQSKNLKSANKFSALDNQIWSFHWNTEPEIRPVSSALSICTQMNTSFPQINCTPNTIYDPL